MSSWSSRAFDSSEMMLVKTEIQSSLASIVGAMSCQVRFGVTTRNFLRCSATLSASAPGARLERDGERAGPVCFVC